MKPKILILGRTAHPDGKETATDIFAGLQPYFANTEYELQIAYYNDLVFDIAPGAIRIVDTRNQQELADYDAVLMTNWFSHASIRKDIALSIGLFLESKGIPCFNTESRQSRSTSKLSQMMLAALHDITIPRTVFSLSYKTLTAALESGDHGIGGGPFVLKDAQASRGSGNYLLAGAHELAAHAAEHTEQHAFMAQAFVASDHTDYRLFMAGGKVRCVIRRIGSADSHLHNTSQGADSELLQSTDIAPEAIIMAETMSSLLHREVTGLDIIFDTAGRPYFLEANPIPQIATGAHVPAKLQALADALKSVAKENRQ